MLDFFDEPLFRALIDGNIPFYEVVHCFGIRVTIGNLPASVSGFTYISKKGCYHLVINRNMSYKTQYRTFMHEIKHIMIDMPKMGYIVGLDMQRYEFESKADVVVEEH
ncbi:MULTISPECIES: hypothetical protein [Tepidanaerobacter]|uniref:hypothetical protein n=1 Tax=Tepidanaerobacter TaxID=499228 RepID=UPI001BD5DBCE|nr:MULTISPECIES: hypothetical protein [Tepidanaerobacter]